MKKMFIMFMSCLLFVGLFTTTVHADGLNVLDDALSKSFNSFPTADNSAWTNGNGGKLYLYSNDIYFTNGSKSAESFSSVGDITLEENNGVYTASNMISAGGGSSMNLTFHFNSSGTLTSIDAELGGDYNVLNGTYSPTMTLGDISKGVDFSTGSGDHWIISNGTSKKILKDSSSECINFLEGVDVYLTIDLSQTLTYINDAQYKYVSSSPSCVAYFNLTDNVLKSITLENASDSSYQGTYTKALLTQDLINGVISQDSTAANWVKISSDPDVNGKQCIYETGFKGGVGGKNIDPGHYLTYISNQKEDQYIDTQSSFKCTFYTKPGDPSSLTKIEYIDLNDHSNDITFEPYKFTQSPTIIRQGSVSSIPFKLNGSFDDDKSKVHVFLDDASGTELTEGTDYILTKGSIIVTLNNSLFDGLPTGVSHTLYVNVDGYIPMNTTFSYEPPLPPSSSSSGSSHPVLNTGVK